MTYRLILYVAALFVLVLLAIAALLLGQPIVALVAIVGAAIVATLGLDEWAGGRREVPEFTGENL